MRICIITNLYPPYAKGGAERVVAEEARELRRQGHDVSVITSMPLDDEGNPAVRTAIEDGIRVHRFYPLNFFHYGELGRHGALARAAWHLWDIANPHATKVVGKILRDEKPDAVHTHNLKGVGYGALRAIRALKLRHVHTLHDVQLAVPSGLIIKGQEKRTEGFAHAAYASLMRWIMGSPTMVISPSRYLMRFYGTRGFFPRSQKVLLANPAPHVQAPDVERQAAPETRFLFLGQIEAHKGIMQLVRVMKALLADGIDARLDVVGVGSVMDEAVKAAGKERRIAFYGKKNPGQFAAMFANADFTVLPSLCYENAPTVVLESFAYGVPVIAADIGGAAELVTDGTNGFRFEAGNDDALAAAMRRACDAKKTWDGLSRAAERSAAPLTVDHHVERLARLYDGRDLGLAKQELVVPIRHLPNA